MAAPVKNMRTIFPVSVVDDTTSTTTATTTTTVITTTTLASRANATLSGGSLNSMAANATVSGTLTLAKSFLLQQVVCNHPTRIRLYATAAAQVADLSRPYTVPLSLGSSHGVICDLYLPSSAYLNWLLTPVAPGSNLDTGTSTIYFAITNIDSVTRSLSTTFTFLPMES